MFKTPLESGFDGRPLTVGAGALAFDDVHFAYDERRPVLSGVTLTIGAGECVGITGGNGSGKSTLLQMLNGMVTPDRGTVSIDGQPLVGADRRSYVSAIGYLPQHCTLFHGTILDNLTMFRGRRYFDEALRLAAELGLDEYIARMPMGYDTVIDSSSHDQLPGGVRQRIAVIRALVDKPKIILFDEANTALDHGSDARLRELLSRLKGHVTILLVSYRPSLLELADRRFELVGAQLRPWVPVAQRSKADAVA